jgi:hypothetical protein
MLTLFRDFDSSEKFNFSITFDDAVMKLILIEKPIVIEHVCVFIYKTQI